LYALDQFRLFARLVTAVFLDDYAGVSEEIRLASCVAQGSERQ
jgi:hypothetical protein